MVQLYSHSYYRTRIGNRIGLYTSYRMVPLTVTMNNAYRNFQGTPSFDIEYLRNGTRETHTCNGINRNSVLETVLFNRSTVMIDDLTWN